MKKMASCGAARTETRVESVFLHCTKGDDVTCAINKIMSELKLTFRQNETVLIKPNWVCPRSSETGATTDLRVVESIVKFLTEKDINVVIGEGSGFEFDTDKVFEILNAKSLAHKYKVRIVNLRKERTREANIGGKVLRKVRLPEIVLEADKILNVPKLKTHRLTGITFAMKNLVGLLPDTERRKAHVLGINQAIVDINNFFRRKVVTIGDAITIMGGHGGPAFGRAFKANILISGQNNAAVDMTACDFIGINHKKVKYLELAKSQNFPSLNVHVNNTVLDKKHIPPADSSVFYRFGHWLVYVFDYFVYPLSKRTFIPRIVSRLGTRPQIDKKKCDKCGACIKACPAEAISEDFRIDFEKCRYLKCFRCYDICSINAIKVKGFSKPER